MKTKKLISALFLTSLTIPFFTSCENDNEVKNNVVINTGLYVLNQGKFESNNASLTYYDFNSSFASTDVFLDKNDRGLGDTGQDMIQYGSKIYIAMYKSSLIEVVDAATGVSLKSIAMLNNASEPAYPRSLTSANGKVYIVLYDGHVTSMDTTSYTLGSKIEVGANPDASVISNNKLYVANTGGFATVKDSTISVIDLTSFTEEKKIVVNLNPGAIQADSQGDIYVVSNGDYYLIPGKFQRIDASTSNVTDIDVAVKNFVIAGDYAYIYDFSYDENWAVANKKIAVYDVKNEKLVTESLVSTAIDNTPYCIAVNPTNNDIYLGVTDYVERGNMYCFSNNGTFKYSFKTGINPAKLVFVSK